METTTATKNVSHDTALEDDADQGLSPVQSVVFKAIVRLCANRNDGSYRYVNLDKLELETGYRRPHIGRALKHLVNEGLIVARDDSVNHMTFYSPARPGAPTSLFDEAMQQAAPEHEEGQGDEDEEPTVATEASSTAGRFENILEDATKQGWTVDQLTAHKPFNGGVLKLSFINGAPKVAS